MLVALSVGARAVGFVNTVDGILEVEGAEGDSVVFTSLYPMLHGLNKI